ncbi:GntR family transcriptional regulator [Hyphococcus flavus]|uniref:GntR family transcriptional regulator n=1 Tax=Hyphococcus flavus TaxID=1866326 RepID=A0AAE9ZBV2_9PROT|nr:GntR family transcriptional regulator [Hyphococcus flavus]WDI31913.1 GntR family transcriptional regulator [Hyphococcus flavus]
MTAELAPDIRAFVARAETIAGVAQPPPPSLPGYIAAWIADRIQFGDFKPGESIRELAVADHFDVSRGPVREALRLLDRDGLVTLRGRKGAIVRKLTDDELEALFHIRAELFAAQAGLAASASERSAAALAAIADGVALLTRLSIAKEATVGDYITVRRAVSVLITSLSGARYLGRMSAVFEREVAVLWASILSPERRRRSAARWTALCKAIEKARVGEAERLARDLVLDSLAEIRRRAETGETPTGETSEATLEKSSKAGASD